MQVWQSLGIIGRPRRPAGRRLRVVRRRRRADPADASIPDARPVGVGARLPLLPADASSGRSTARVRALPTATVHCGWSAESLEQADDHVELTLRRVREPRVGELEPTDETRTVRARYVIGADGANSFVRAAAGIAFDDQGFAERWLVVDLRPDDVDALSSICRAVPVVRSGPAAHAHAQRPVAPALRVHAAAGRASRGLRGRGARVVAAGAVVHARRRRARAPRGLRVPRPARDDHARRPACCSPATPRTRCRRSWARGCARACATPRTSRGGWTSSCAALADDGLLDGYTTERRAAERVDREPLDRDGPRVVHARPAAPPPSATPRCAPPTRRRRSALPPLQDGHAGRRPAAGRHPRRAGRGPRRRPRGPLRRRRRQGLRAAHPARAAPVRRARGVPGAHRRARRRPRRARGPRRPADRLARRAPRSRPCSSGPTPTSSAPSSAPDDVPALVDDLRAHLSTTESRITADVH